MARFHINPVTGNPGECRATKACPFGGIDEHFDSIEEARESYEAIMAPHLLLSEKSGSLTSFREKLIGEAETEAIIANQKGKIFQAEAKRQELGEVAHFIGTLKEHSVRTDVRDSYTQASEEISKAVLRADWQTAEGRTEALRELQDKVSDFNARGVAMEESLDAMTRDHFHNPWFDAAGQLENALEGTYDLLED